MVSKLRLAFAAATALLIVLSGVPVEAHHSETPSRASPCPNAGWADSDGDGLTDGQEVEFSDGNGRHGLDPCHPDSDGDGMPDGWEVSYGLNPLVAWVRDSDEDGLVDIEEYCYGLTPEACHRRTYDTFLHYRNCQPSCTDGVYRGGTDPSNPDSDNDALCDGGGTEACRALSLAGDARGERDWETDARDPDSESGSNGGNGGDGLPDGWEAAFGLDPLAYDAHLDSDADTHPNAQFLWSNAREYCFSSSYAHSFSGWRDSASCAEMSESWIRSNGVFRFGTRPDQQDTDGDGFNDGTEVHTTRTGRDGYYDPTSWTHAPPPRLDAGVDSDGDGLDDPTERSLGTNPLDPDTDGDELPDGQEIDLGLDPRAWDTDKDGLGDGEEAGPSGVMSAGGGDRRASDPKRRDSDGDGLTDAEEYVYDTDPHSDDSDGDGLSDKWELMVTHTNPLLADTDGDGTSDFYNYWGGSTVQRPDRDRDGLPDERELEIGTNPDDADTDGDLLSDGAEVRFFYSSPLAWDTDGDRIPDSADARPHVEDAAPIVRSIRPLDASRPDFREGVAVEVFDHTRVSLPIRSVQVRGYTGNGLPCAGYGQQHVEVESRRVGPRGKTFELRFSPTVDCIDAGYEFDIVDEHGNGVHIDLRLRGNCMERGSLIPWYVPSPIPSGREAIYGEGTKSMARAVFELPGGAFMRIAGRLPTVVSLLYTMAQFPGRGIPVSAIALTAYGALDTATASLYDCTTSGETIRRIEPQETEPDSYARDRESRKVFLNRDGSHETIVDPEGRRHTRGAGLVRAQAESPGITAEAILRIIRTGDIVPVPGALNARYYCGIADSGPYRVLAWDNFVVTATREWEHCPRL